MVRPVRFLGDSLRSSRDFPSAVRHNAGYQLDKVQRGEQPDDFKPMPTGAYRVIYVARRAEAVYVLHALQKKTQTTSRNDIQIAKRRFRQLLGGGI